MGAGRGFRVQGGTVHELRASRGGEQLQLVLETALDGDSPQHPRADVRAALDLLADGDRVEERGAVYTKAEVVDFMLDLVGYTSDQPLVKRRILEPSFGGGEFLEAVVRRLLVSWRAHPESARDPKCLRPCVRGVELHRATFRATRQRLREQLLAANLSGTTADDLLTHWLLCDDFLLCNELDAVDTIVGNPPYVRLERVPEALLRRYRDRYPTMYDRADLYVAFWERALELLQEGACVAFICADRWTKNRYGERLRALIAEHHHLRAYVDLSEADAFQTQVSAYPGVALVQRAPSGPTRAVRTQRTDVETLTALARDIADPRRAIPPVTEHSITGKRGAPWLFFVGDGLSLLRRLEGDFPSLEEVGCRVGIGVATGADRVFIAPWDVLDVEQGRKLPLVMTKDLVDGQLRWRGMGVLNPYDEHGELISLASYPLFARYVEEHRETLSQRHCAKKTPDRWYRTIDKIHVPLTATPKLLIPDIRGKADVIWEGGTLYPHHNLYYVVSRSWDLRALQAVLRSSVLQLVISAYSTRMRGGYLRFQAQYLRRLHLPHWEDVSAPLRAALREAATHPCQRDIDDLVAKVICLSPEEMQWLERQRTQA